MAYPVARRNADQNRLLVRYFMGGLRDLEIAGSVIRNHDPRNLDDAVTHVTQLCRAFQRLDTTGTHGDRCSKTSGRGSRESENGNGVVGSSRVCRTLIQRTHDKRATPPELV
jgi:hypothetical protein